MEETPGFLFKESSVGLSYIIPSESTQEGCDNYERLPPITIRPRIQYDERILDTSAVKEYVDVLQSGKTMTASFKACDEHTSKEYLLSPGRRSEFIQSNSGTISFETAVDGLLRYTVEKGFVCLHYTLKRDDGGHLWLGTLPESDSSVETSNIQLALTLKRGVGGTAGMKSEAKLLDEGGILGLLLGEDPLSLLQYYDALNTMEGDDSKVFDDIPETLTPAEKKMALNTLCCRVDLYMDRMLLDTLSHMEISILVQATKHFGKTISDTIRRKNWHAHLESLKSLSLPLRDAYPEYMTSIFIHVEILLDGIMGTLHGRDPLDPLTQQQFFLKMYVCFLAVLAPRQKIQHLAPLYMVSTRDCFTSDIVGEDTECDMGEGQTFRKTRWFIRSTDVPVQFDSVMDNLLRGAEDHSMEAMILDGIISTIVQSTERRSNYKGYLLPLGVTTYNGVYTSRDLDSIEACCDKLHETALQGILPKECYHATASKKGSLKRTKYFFGSRYLWSREQLKSPHAKVAGGIRHDVPKPQAWMRDMVEQPMVSAKLVPDGFVDAIALNIYHDGSEGIQSHYDDSRRFHQPIYSLRLFSDSRLSFGTQLYGFTNGLFFIPMPRGCVTVMENYGFAANGVKHCVRPIDMTGKSAAMILRKIHTEALKTAEELFWKDVLQKLDGLSLVPSSPEHLIWNPLFDDRTTTFRRAPLTVRASTKERQTQVREKKVIRAMMHDVLASITRQERKETQNKRKIFYIMSGMTKRVCTAERIGIDVSPTTNCQIFNVLDDMISFCEYPTHLRRKKRKKDQL